MALFYCKYGIDFYHEERIVDVEDIDAAEQYAYDKSIEIYDSYEGLHGIPSIDDYLSEYKDVDDAEEAYINNREDMLDYYWEEYDPTNSTHYQVYNNY